MKDKMDAFKNLRLMSKTYAEQDMKERASMQEEDSEDLQVGRMDAKKLNMDNEFAQREKDNSDKLALAKVEQLRAEIRMMNEAKRQLLEQEIQDIIDQEDREEKQVQVNKLDEKFTNFDKISDEKTRQEEIRIRNARKEQLAAEMKNFEIEKAKFEQDFEEMKTEVIQRVRIELTGNGCYAIFRKLAD